MRQVVIPAGRRLVGTIPIPTPGGVVEMDLYFKAIEELSVDLDQAADEGARELAAQARQTIARNLAAGLDPKGAPLPPLADATIQRRRAKGAADATTPMHATGETAAAVSVKRTGTATYEVAIPVKPGLGEVRRSPDRGAAARQRAAQACDRQGREVAAGEDEVRAGPISRHRMVRLHAPLPRRTTCPSLAG